MLKCPSCGASNRPTAKLCASCGKPLSAPASPPPAQLPLAPPRPPERIKRSVARPRQSRLEIAKYPVSGVWRENAPIYWVLPREVDPATPHYLAIEMPAELDGATFAKLRALQHVSLVPVLDQASEKYGRWYLIVAHVPGTPLDKMQSSLGAKHACQVFEKIVHVVNYLHDQGWVLSPSLHQASASNVLSQWIKEGIRALGGNVTESHDPVNRLLKAFAIDTTTDTLVLFDYTLWERAPRAKSDCQLAHELDLQLLGKVWNWLQTSGRTPQAIARKVTSRMQEIFVPDTQELAETLSKLAPPSEPGKTIPLPQLPPPSAATRKLPVTKLAFASQTDAGKERKHNEDNYLEQRLDDVSGLFIVADGMGGHSAGEVASKMAIDDIYKSATEQWGELQYSRQPESIRQMLGNWITRANQKIFEAGQQAGNNMGTTLTAALVINGAVYAANVGDSRTYLFRFGQLYPLTRDHSLVASLVQAGLIKPDEVYTHPQRNQIFRSLGQQNKMNVDVFNPVQLGNEDRLLLCSDGLWEMVRPAEIVQLLSQNPEPSAACAALVAAANQNGGEDNITVVIVRVTFE